MAKSLTSKLCALAIVHLNLRRFPAQAIHVSLSATMNDPIEARRSWFVECQLSNAAQFLSDPSKFESPKFGLWEYRFNLRRYELEKSMIELEMLALEIGCKSGLWRRLKKVAETLGTQAKAGQYEHEFHRAFTRNA